MSDLAVEMRQSQAITQVTINGHRYQRLIVETPFCGGCLSMIGRLHVMGCNKEMCPMCQIIPLNTCGCLNGD